LIFFFKVKKSPKRKKNININIKICLKLKNLIKNKNLLDKAYSSEVEHTAHNGPVVGSIPTKPIFIKE
jgi:hypothetical protein